MSVKKQYGKDILLLLLGTILPFLILKSLVYYNMINMANLKSNLGTLFSAQLTVISLSISILAIVSVVLSDKLYGVNLSYYIMNKRNLFNNKFYIYLELIIAILTSIALINELSFLVYYLFSVSIIILLFMVHNIFDVLRGKEFFKDDIKDYIINNIKKMNNISSQRELLINLHTEMINACDNNELVYLNSILEFSKDIFININNDKIKILYIEIFTDVYEVATQKGDIRLSKYLLEFIITIFKKNNKYYPDFNKEIYQNNKKYIINMIAKLQSKNDIISITSRLLQEVANKADNKTYKKEDYFLHFLYDELKKYKELYKSNELQDINIKLYNTLIDLIENNKCYLNNYQKKYLCIEMVYYTKLSLDDSSGLVTSTFFNKIKKINSTDLNDMYKQYIILIYMYIYLYLQKEDIIKCDMLYMKINTFRNPLINIILNNYNFNKDTIKLFEEILTECETPMLEKLNTSSYVCNIQSYNVIRDFVIFAILNKSIKINTNECMEINIKNTKNNIKNNLQELDKNILMKYISHYLGEKKEEIIKRYKIYCYFSQIDWSNYIDLLLNVFDKINNTI